MTDVLATSSQGIVDDRGVLRDLSADERKDLAQKIGVVNGIVDLLAGDLVNQECAALGLPPLAVRHVQQGESQQDSLLPLVKSMGYSLLQAAKYAAVARAWPLSDRVSGLTYKHYEYVQGCDGSPGKLTRAQAITILQEAQLGYTKEIKGPKGVTTYKKVVPHPASWVEKKRQAVEGKAAAKIAIAGHKGSHDVTTSVVPDVEKALTGIGVPTPKAKKLTQKVEKAIKAEHKKLQDVFVESINAEVTKRVEEERGTLHEAHKEYTERKEEYETLFKGVVKPITEQEFKILRQFCHPDKHPGNEAKAGQAYEIVMTVGERLQYAKKRIA